MRRWRRDVGRKKRKIGRELEAINFTVTCSLVNRPNNLGWSVLMSMPYSGYLLSVWSTQPFDRQLSLLSCGQTISLRVNKGIRSKPLCKDIHSKSTNAQVTRVELLYTYEVAPMANELVTYGARFRSRHSAPEFGGQTTSSLKRSTQAPRGSQMREKCGIFPNETAVVDHGIET